MNDIRFALRMLCKHPGFTAVAVLTLALGISANTTIFATISGIFFQPLPVKDPDRLVLVLQKSAVWKMPHGHSWPDYLDYKERVGSFEDALAVTLHPAHISVPGQQAERAWVEATSGNYFSMLGIDAAHGRLFLPDEAKHAGSDPVIVLSHSYWQRRFGGDPSVVGVTIHVNGNPFTVIGVAPAKFASAQWSLAPAAFVPASMLQSLRPDGENMLKERGAPMFKVMARLKPGVTMAQARAAVAGVADQIARDFPKEHKEARVFIAPEQRCRPEPTFADFMPVIVSVFTIMVVLVLLIACANVANLMFARAIVRQKEMGIRTALGASRGRLIRQLLIESVLLALVAGVVGFVISSWSGRLLSQFTPKGDIPLRVDHAWDWRVPVFTVLMAIVAGVVTGVIPALRATKLDLQGILKDGNALVGSTRHRFRSSFVVSQVAICIVVLVGGGLFVRSLQQVAHMDLGFRTDHLVMASLDLSLARYEGDRERRFYDELLDKVKAIPGARSASLAQAVPFDYGFEIPQVAPEERSAEDRDFTAVHCNRISWEHLSTFGTTMLRGRDFTSADDANAPKVIIVNAVMAERFWPGQEAIGKRIRLRLGGDLWQVVGVARNSKYVMIGEEPRPYFYMPLPQGRCSPVTLHVWTSTDPAALIPPLREILRQMDPHLPIYNVRTMDEHLRESAFALMPLRMGATLAGFQGVLALFLAVMGLYGVVSYVVSQRKREIGIRIALGAQKVDILGLVLRSGLRLTVIGVGIGLLASLGLAALISKVLYGLAPASIPVLVAVPLLVIGVSLLACYLPARRAAIIDPMEALRYE